MQDSYDVFDVDVHFREDFWDLISYFDEPWRSRLEDGGIYSQIRFYPRSTGDPSVGGRIKWEETDSYPRAMSPEEIPEAMDWLGLDTVLVLSDLVLASGGINTDDDRNAVVTSAVSDYLLDHVLDPDAGIYSAIPAPYNNPARAVDLIDRVGDEDAFVGVYMVTEGVEPPLGNEQYEPVYEVAERKGLPVVFHAGGSSMDRYHTSGYEKFIETHTLGFLESNVGQMTSLLVQGIPEKFPDLDVVFMESGLFWVPMLMHRLDAEYMKRQSEAPLLEKRPSKYMKEFYYGTQPLEHPEDESHLEHVVEMMGGPDRLLFASDYPHWDFDFPSVISDLSFLSEAEKQQVFADNAREVFGL